MKVDLTRPETNVAELSVEVDAERISEVRQSVYRKMVGRYNIPGFRRGKAPLAILQRHVGVGFFEQEVLDELISAVYPEALDEAGIEPVSQPDFDLREWEPGAPTLTFTVRVTTKPEVALGQYTGLEVPKQTPDVPDAAVEAELDQLRRAFAQFVDAADDVPLANGSIAVIDFEGYVDGELFEGGASKGYPLELGSGAFIPGFEEQLLGAVTGDEREVKVTFPVGYGGELGGKDAVFKVKVTKHRQRELPELDDLFARRAAPLLGLKLPETPKTEAPQQAEGAAADADAPAAAAADDAAEATADATAAPAEGEQAGAEPPVPAIEFGLTELRSEILRRLEASAQRRADDEYEERVIAKVAALCELDVPAVMIDRVVESRRREYAEMLQRNGTDIDRYLSERDMSDADLRERLRPAALEAVRRELVIEAVGRQEGIVATDREVDERIITFAQVRNQDPVELRAQLAGDNGEGLEQVREELMRRKTIDFLVGAQVAVPLLPEATDDAGAGAVDVEDSKDGTTSGEVNSIKESGGETGSDAPEADSR